MEIETGKPYSGAIVGGKHLFALRVYIEDTDLGGIVYHANYLRFLERARSDMLRVAGINQRAAIESGAGAYAVAEVQLSFLRPARLDDELLIESALEEVRGVSCIISQTVRRGEEIVAQARLKVAFVTPAGRPRRQPAEWVEKFRMIQSQAPQTAGSAP